MRYLVLKSEIFHHKEHLADRIENLCHGRDLPVKVPTFGNYANDMHLRLSTGIERHINYRLGEPEDGTVEPEILCYVHKLQETGDGKCQLVEEFNLKLLEARSDNPMNKRFQVCQHHGTEWRRLGSVTSAMSAICVSFLPTSRLEIENLK
jgi:hypothetical protein